MFSDRRPSVSIISNYQSGGITAHTVNIDERSVPTAHAEPVDATGRHWRIVVENGPVGALNIAARAPSVRSVRAFQEGDHWSTGLRVYSRPGVAGCRLAGAYSNVEAVVQADDPDDMVNLEVILDPQ